MTTQVKARIHLAEQRMNAHGLGYSCSQHVLHSSGDEIYVYDVFLEGVAPFLRSVFESMLSIAIPLKNNVWVDTGESSSEKIEEQEVAVLTIEEGEAIHVYNVDYNALSSFVLVQLPLTDVLEFKKIGVFDNNGLQKIVSSHEYDIYIGKFSGRQEGTLSVEQVDVHAFVLEGAFEFQNRLLQPRDALTLSGVNEIEFEALSNEAKLILLVHK